MYAGLKISLDINRLQSLPGIHQNNQFSKILAEDKRSVNKGLEDILLSNGHLSADKIRQIWFPTIHREVFISHSHRDEDVAKALATWLYDNFGITSFIDSTVWGFCDDLLRSIDNEYCLNDDNRYYNYNKRNISTAHVHMILSSALNSMIDSSECLIFLNTENSTKPMESIKNESTTYSPWIFGELSFSRVVRRRPLIDHRPRPITEAFDSVESSNRQLTIEYPAPLEHLTEMTPKFLEVWQEKYFPNPHKALNWLYMHHGIVD